MHTFNTSHSLLNPQFQALSDNINHSPESFLYIENTSIEWAEIREIATIRSTNRQTRSQFSSFYAYCGSCTWSGDLFYISKMSLYIFHDKVPPKNRRLGGICKMTMYTNTANDAAVHDLNCKKWYLPRMNSAVFRIVYDGACYVRLTCKSIHTVIIYFLRYTYTWFIYF